MAEIPRISHPLSAGELKGGPRFSITRPPGVVVIVVVDYIDSLSVDFLKVFPEMMESGH
jgi:hypothetical protein